MTGAAAPCLALDFDGTLVGCAPKQLAALRAAMVFCGADRVDLAEHWRLKRQGAATVAALRAQGLSAECAREVGERWRLEVERPPWLSLDSPFPGVHELLCELSGRGVTLVLVSARRDPSLLRLQLRQMGWLAFFAAVCVAAPADAVRGKAAALAAWAPRLFIGDTEIDAAAAKLAGTPFAGVASGQRGPDHLSSLGVTTVFAGVMDAVRAGWVEAQT